MSEQKKRPDTCRWEQDEDGVWDTGCGNRFMVINEDTPKENGFRYCCYCGGKLLQSKYRER